MYNYQFGFRKNYSTSLALIDVVDNIYEKLDANQTVVGIYVDLTKASDMVNPIFYFINYKTIVFEVQLIGGLKAILVIDNNILILIMCHPA